MSGDHVFVSLGESAAVDGFSGATPLGQFRFICLGQAEVFGVTGSPLSLADMFLGLYPGSWGETSTLCILIGLAILLATGIASWRIIVSGVVGALLMSVLANNFATPLYPVTYLSPVEQALSRRIRICNRVHGY